MSGLLGRIAGRLLAGALAATYLACLAASSAHLAVWIETDGDIGVTFAAAVDDGSAGDGSDDRQDGWHPAQGDHDDPYLVVSLKLDTKSLKADGAGVLPGAEIGIVALAPVAEGAACAPAPDRRARARAPPRGDPALVLRRSSVLLI